MHLVIGGRGLVGSALCGELTRRDIEWRATTRRSHEAIQGSGYCYLDLADVSNDALYKLPPDPRCVYIVAAMSRFVDCESNPVSWRVNVDAPIALARYYSDVAHVVFISSEAVERCGGTAYGRQKAAAEAFMHTIGACIIRPSKISNETVHIFAEAVVDTALKLRYGVTRWEPCVVDPWRGGELRRAVA